MLERGICNICDGKYQENLKKKKTNKGIKTVQAGGKLGCHWRILSPLILTSTLKSDDAKLWDARLRWYVFLRDKLVWQSYRGRDVGSRVIGLLTKGRDCKPTWNCWHRHSSWQSGVFIFCRRTVGVKYQFMSTAGILGKLTEWKIQL